MNIKQWEDKNLSHFSYAIVSEKEIVLIDPSRNPKQYIDFAEEKNARIIGIIETHPHADFVSGHLEISKLTGATIYVSKLVHADYPHTTFDEGDIIQMGNITLKALNTPGHSPDSISILMEAEGVQKAIFSGDTLFIGDCGRPDLREGAGNMREKKLDLAKKMYHTLRDKYLPLEDDVVLYPAHGAGSLCGKGLSKADSSTMGKEKKENWTLQPTTEEEFVEALLSEQPFVPAYFPYNVEINRKGAANFKESVAAVKIGKSIVSKEDAAGLDEEIMIVDAREESKYKNGHLANSVNLMEGGKFETWLGTIIKPEESFYLAGESEEQLQNLIDRAAVIGYEPQIKQAFVVEYGEEKEPQLNVEEFKNNQQAYTIVDVRNYSEVKEGKFFEDSISMPLPEVREKVNSLPTDKPIVVHCAGGYRSAAASSIIQNAINNGVEIYDLGEAVKEFQ